MNFKEIRSQFPITNSALYLNSASQSPLNNLVYEKLQSFLKIELNPLGKKAFDRNSIKILLASLLGGLPEEYALITSTGVGMGIVAQGIDFKPGDNVVLPEKEHWNNTFPWLQLEKKGVEIRFVKLSDDNSFHADDFRKMVDDKTRVVALAAVRYNSGFKPNLAEIGQIAHEKGAIFVVDVAQAAGMIPINVEKDHIDVMSGCGFKWLLGMHGTGFLYVNKRIIHKVNPSMPGMYAAEHNYHKLNFHHDSRKFETGTIAYSLFHSWSAGLDLLLNIGVKNIYEIVLQNTDVLIEGLQKKGYQLISPIKNRQDRTAIVHFNTGDINTTKTIFEELTNKGVLITLQGSNIRVSPNFFNTNEEISKFLKLL